MRAILALASVAATSPAIAVGAVSYSFVTDAPSYDWKGGPVQVSVYLQEALDGDSTSLIEPDGLAGAAFRVDRAAGSGFIISDLLRNPAFDGDMFTTITVAPTTARINESTGFFSDGVRFDSPGRVWLGTVVLTRDDSEPLQPTTFEIGLYDDATGNIATAGANFMALDDPAHPAYDAPQGGYSFTVIPEPAALALLTAAAPALLLRRRSI